MPEASTQKKKITSPFHGFLPFLWLGLVCMGGIIIGDLVSLPSWVWLMGLLLCLSVLALAYCLPPHHLITYYLRKWMRTSQRLPLGLLLAAFCLGGWRYVSTRVLVAPGYVAYYNEHGTVQLTGTIIKPPEYRDAFTHLTLQVEELQLLSEGEQMVDPESIRGMVLVQVHPGSDWAYGYRLRVIGQLSTPPENANFSYRDYLARKEIHSLMINPKIDRVEFSQGNFLKSFIFNLQARAYVVLQQLYPSPESDLLAGILLGRDQGLSPDLQEDFRRTGTSHIIAISGFNIAILAGLFSSLFTRLLGRKWGALFAVGSIFAYTVLVGGEPAVSRAAIMGALGVLGGMFGRRQNGLNSLGLAVLAMVLINPNLPWDVGFQLSAAATLGLVLYAQPLTDRFTKYAAERIGEERSKKLAGPIGEIFLFTLAAQVTTLPIMMYHFGSVSWVMLLSNPLILPAQPLLMILGGISLLVGLVFSGLGQGIAIFTLPFVRYTIQVVTMLARLPGADWHLPDFHVLWVGIYFAVLFFLTVFPRSEQKQIVQKVLSPQLGLLILTGLTLFTWSRVLSAPDGRLHLTLLDGEGTVLLLTPGGNAVLIGGGASPSSLNQALGQMLPAGKNTLDAVIVGSPDKEDLLGLIGIIKNYSIGTALIGVEPHVNQSSLMMSALFAEKGTPIYSMHMGQKLDLGNEILLEVLWKGDRGAVLWLEWKDYCALIPTGKVEDHWFNVPAAPDLLLLPDRLKPQDMPLDLINMWSPVAILFPLPSRDVPLLGEHPLITLLHGYPLIHTAQHGWVRVSTNGQNLWVRTEK